VAVPLEAGGLGPELLRAYLAATPPPTAEPAAADHGSPRISVVVASRDRPRDLAVCLDSLLRQRYSAFEIIVVDNAPSSSETKEMVQSRYLSTGRVKYVRENRPGLGQAHNAGLTAAGSPILAFTDDDVVADPGWLAAIAGAFASANEVGCVTGLILPMEMETRAQYWIEQHGGFGKGFARKIYDRREHRGRSALFPYAAGRFGSGANMAFRRDALIRIGGFNAALGAGTIARGGDDLAAFCSVIRADLRLVYEPRAIIWHRHRRSAEGLERQAFGYGVGLGAYLAAMALSGPAAALELARAVPAGIAHLLASSSEKNRRLAADYPARLIWRERLGIVAGVPAYLRSRAALRRAVPREGIIDAAPQQL
jgi:GT2 family glycosyltransferase